MIDDPESIRPLDAIGELVYLKDAEHALYRLESCTFDEGEADGGGPPFRARLHLAGERIDRARHPLGVDVKAVTFDRLDVRRETGGYVARVMLDT